MGSFEKSFYTNPEQFLPKVTLTPDEIQAIERQLAKEGKRPAEIAEIIARKKEQAKTATELLQEDVLDVARKGNEKELKKKLGGEPETKM